MIESSLSPEQLLALLEAVIRDAPEFRYQEPLSDTEIRWLGRADALIEASGSISATAAFRTARNFLGTIMQDRSKLLIALHDAYHKVELTAPSASKGAFIPAGETWNGYAALIRLIQNKCDDLLIVDPYLNSAIYTDFAPHSVASKGVRCLTARRSENHPGLLASAQKWASDPVSQAHQVEVRYAPDRALHDRLIIIDKSEVWLVSQSLKDFAKRSPASVSRAEAEIGSMKVQHYELLWTQSTPIT